MALLLKLINFERKKSKDISIFSTKVTGVSQSCKFLNGGSLEMKSTVFLIILEIQGASRPSSILIVNMFFLFTFKIFLRIFKNLNFLQNRKPLKHIYFLFISFINLPCGHMMSHKKIGPDRFICFDVYWIQTDRQAKFIYRYRMWKRILTVNSSPSGET